MNVFISCGKKKQDHVCRAVNMYIGNYYKAELDAAKAIGGRLWILSAKYGLLRPDDIIEPYNLRLTWLNAVQRKEWAGRVLAQLHMYNVDLEEEAIFLCGNDYSKLVADNFTNCKMLQAKSMSDRIAKLKKIVERSKQ